MNSTIGIIIDVVIGLILLICGIIGYKKGFLHSVLSLFSWTVCVIVAVFVAKYVANWINGIYDVSSLIGKEIENGLINSNEFFTMAINAFKDYPTAGGGANNIISSIPEGTNGLVRKIIELVFTHTSIDMDSQQTIASFLGASLGHICMIIISGIVVFIALMIIVALLRKIFDKITKTKILGGLNKILGLVLGLAKAAVIVIIANCALVGLSLIPTVNKFITPIIQDNTYVEKFVYNKTDELVGKYIVEGEVVQNIIDSLWESREN